MLLVSTQGSDPCNPGSSPGRTSYWNSFTKKKLQQSKKKKFKKMYSINTNRKNKMQSKDCSQKPTAKDLTNWSNIKHAGKIQQTKIEKRKINKKLGRIYIYQKYTCNITVILIQYFYYITTSRLLLLHFYYCIMLTTLVLLHLLLLQQYYYSITNKILLLHYYWHNTC